MWCMNNIYCCILLDVVGPFVVLWNVVLCLIYFSLGHNMRSFLSNSVYCRAYFPIYYS